MSWCLLIKASLNIDYCSTLYCCSFSIAMRIFWRNHHKKNTNKEAEINKINITLTYSSFHLFLLFTVNTSGCLKSKTRTTNEHPFPQRDFILHRSTCFGSTPLAVRTAGLEDECCYGIVIQKFYEEKFFNFIIYFIALGVICKPIISTKFWSVLWIMKAVSRWLAAENAVRSWKTSVRD
jgi:hypothetical protein